MKAFLIKKIEFSFYFTKIEVLEQSKIKYSM